jgi:Predicted AAA-ATPase/PD-(D/E)XK nuclease superfamily
MIKIPYGESNFQSLIEDDYYYVDRTSYITMLEESPKYLFYLRPRRFGKSLFVSMLHYYYGLEHKELFQRLFGKLDIGRTPTKNANKYMVLRFEFSRIDTKDAESTFSGFLSNVKSGVSSFLTEYHEFFSKLEKEQVIQINTPNELLKKVFDLHKDKNIPHPIYVLIDEYDHFTNELISFQHTVFKDVVSKNGYVRKFYEAIKTATGDGVVERFFATGVSPVTLDSLTSGFNITENASLRVGLHKMMGFDDSEVKTILKEIDLPEDILDSTMSDLKAWYDGYKFNHAALEHIYNPDMVLYFAKEFQRNRKYPDTLLDINIASDYHKIKSIFSIQGKEKENLEMLHKLTENGIVQAELTYQFNFERDFTKADVLSLLFYMGFLTIKDAELNVMNFSFPNFVIQKLYAEYFIHLVKQQAALPIDNSNVTQAILDLAQRGNIQPIINETTLILENLSNRDSKDFNEVSLKAVMVSLLRLQGFYYVHSEFEVSRGYIDLFLEAIRGYEPKYEIALELKYFKKNETPDIEKEFTLAEAQLRKYISSEKFSSRPSVKAFVVVGVGPKVEWREITIKNF